MQSGSRDALVSSIKSPRWVAYLSSYLFLQARPHNPTPCKTLHNPAVSLVAMTFSSTSTTGPDPVINQSAIPTRPTALMAGSLNTVTSSSTSTTAARTAGTSTEQSAMQCAASAWTCVAMATLELAFRDPPSKSGSGAPGKGCGGAGTVRGHVAGCCYRAPNRSHARSGDLAALSGAISRVVRGNARDRLSTSTCPSSPLQLELDELKCWVLYVTWGGSSLRVRQETGLVFGLEAFGRRRWKQSWI